MPLKINSFSSNLPLLSILIPQKEIHSFFCTRNQQCTAGVIQTLTLENRKPLCEFPAFSEQLPKKEIPLFRTVIQTLTPENIQPLCEFPALSEQLPKKEIFPFLEPSAAGGKQQRPATLFIEGCTVNFIPSFEGEGVYFGGFLFFPALN